MSLQAGRENEYGDTDEEVLAQILTSIVTLINLLSIAHNQKQLEPGTLTRVQLAAGMDVTTIKPK